MRSCEVSFLLDELPLFVVWARHHCKPGLEVHHIFGRGTRVHEDHCNLILVENAAHDWGHDVSPRAFELACIRAKLGCDDVKAAEIARGMLPICKRATLSGRVEYLMDGQCEAVAGWGDWVMSRIHSLGVE